MQYTRLTLTLNEDEASILRKLANRELRRPRDQAHIILRQALGLVVEKKEGAALSLPAGAAPSHTHQ